MGCRNGGSFGGFVVFLTPCDSPCPAGVTFRGVCGSAGTRRGWERSPHLSQPQRPRGLRFAFARFHLDPWERRRYSRTEDTHVRGSVRRDLVPGLSSAVSRSGFPAVRGDHGHLPHGVLVAAERWRDAPTEEAAQGLSPARRGSPGRSP